MKKILSLIVVSTLMVILVGICSCTDSNRNESSEMTTSSFISSQTTTIITPSPIPTYAPGTELYGMLSVTGEVVIEPKYEHIDLFSDEGLARFCDHGRWGFVNTDGEKVIPAQYENANNFSEGLAAVKVDGVWGFIDTSGEMVIEPQFEGVQSGFLYGRCVFQSGMLQGLLDKTGNVIVEAQYEEIILSCEDYFITSENNDTFGVIDRDGQVVLDQQNRPVDYVHENGYIFFPIERSRHESIYVETATNPNGEKEYAIDYETVIICRNYDGSAYLEAKENTDNLWGIYNLNTGRFVTERFYMAIGFWGDDSEYAFIEKDLLFGVLDSASGNAILDRVYTWVEYSTADQFAAWTGNFKHKVFDHEGNYLFKNENGNLICCYLDRFDCWLYYYGPAHDNKYGLMNLQGEIVFPNDYSFEWFSDGSPYIQEEPNIYSFIRNDFTVIERGPYREVFDYTKESGIIIAIDDLNRCEVLDVRGTLLFSSDRPMKYVIGNAEYFVYGQKVD